MKTSIVNLALLAAFLQSPISSRATELTLTSADLTYRNCSAKVTTAITNNIAESSTVGIDDIVLQFTCDDHTSFTGYVSYDDASMSALCKSFNLKGGTVVELTNRNTPLDTYRIAVDANNKIRLSLSPGQNALSAISCDK